MSRAARPTDGSRWIGARPGPGALLLIGLELGVFLLYMFLDAPLWMRAHLGLTPSRALGPEPWQLVTSGLLHLSASSMLFAGLTLWFFATPVEERVGRTRMLVTFAVSQITGALVFAALGRLFSVDMLLAGCEPGSLGLLAAFGVVYSRVPVSPFGVAEMRGRTMALIFLGITAVQYLLHGEWMMLAAVGAGAGAGWATMTWGLGGGDVTVNPIKRVAAAWDRFRLWRLRRRYKVIPGGRDQKRYLN